MQALWQFFPQVFAVHVVHPKICVLLSFIVTFAIAISEQCAFATHKSYLKVKQELEGAPKGKCIQLQSFEPTRWVQKLLL